MEEIADLPLRPGLRLSEAAWVIDGTAEERLRIRVDDQPGIKLSIQKQPQANTVAVVDAVAERLDQFQARGEIPAQVVVARVDDQARYIRRSLDNAVNAAVSGALLAMAVIYLFLGSLRRTLIIGSAIPIAVLVTFILMAGAGLNFNIMTLGVGMLVDNTIVVLENIYRHQCLGEAPDQAAAAGASEVASAVVAATTTNLAAVLPFLFIGGLVGLLFRELIFTISAAILASLVVALTLVPALAGKVPAGREGLGRRIIDQVLALLQDGYARALRVLMRVGWLVIAAFAAALAYRVPLLDTARQEFLPKMDEGRVQVNLTADSGIDLEIMDAQTRRIEGLLTAQAQVRSLFTTVGGSVFGRSQVENANRAGIQVQLSPLAERGISVDQWIRDMRKGIAGLRNPLIIMLTVPFALTGVVLGLQWAELPVSMPVWLGLVMLAGIVVNNAIVLVEFIELQRAAGLDPDAAILEAARLRL